MKTEFNVERVCERVHLCVVEAPDVMCIPGPPHFEIRNGSLYVTFPKALMNSIEVRPGPGHPEWDGQFGEAREMNIGDSMEYRLDEKTGHMVPKSSVIEGVIDASVADSNAQNSAEAGTITKPKRRGK